MFDRIKSLIATTVTGLLSVAARDVTQTLSSSTTLVVAPHPDDETLGCGALIARLRARGDRVVIVVVTDGAHSTGSSRLKPDELVALRRTELTNAAGKLGVPSADVHMLNFPDGGTEGRGGEVADALASLVESVSPALCLAPLHLDKHPDHRTTAEAVFELKRRKALRCPVYLYPIWIWTPRLMMLTLAMAPTCAVRISTNGFLETKRLALKEHRSQFENVTGETNWQSLSPEFAARYLKAWEVFFRHA